MAGDEVEVTAKGIEHDVGLEDKTVEGTGERIVDIETAAGEIGGQVGWGGGITPIDKGVGGSAEGKVGIASDK